ncbi:hypothetical protein E0K89_008035, partial [Aquicoccus sp. SCR17]|nr:hypothetical protein [Carideicomes alvinocaridis]
MKPDFALTLSFDGIGLLMRADDAWRLVGEAPADATDLDSQLAALRDRAAAAGDAAKAGGLPVKLVIPDEQIRYLVIPAPAEGEGEAAARAALDGATPYAVSDLVIDRQRDGDRLCIAAVARETLEEAEEFAREHGFAPLCFTAAPEMGVFPGEVFFGPTTAAAAMQDQPQRDTTPARVPEPLAPDAETPAGDVVGSATGSGVAASVAPADEVAPEAPEDETGRETAGDPEGGDPHEAPTEPQLSQAPTEEDHPAPPSADADPVPADSAPDINASPDAAPVSEPAAAPEEASTSKSVPTPDAAAASDDAPAPDPVTEGSEPPSSSAAGEEESPAEPESTTPAPEISAAAPSTASEPAARVTEPDTGAPAADPHSGDGDEETATTTPAGSTGAEGKNQRESETNAERSAKHTAVVPSTASAKVPETPASPTAEGASGDVSNPKTAPETDQEASGKTDRTAASAGNKTAETDSTPTAFTSRRTAQEAAPSVPGPRKPGKTGKAGDAPMPIPAFTPKPVAGDEAAPETEAPAPVGFFSRRKQERSEPAQTRRAEPGAPARKPAQEGSATPKLARPAAAPASAGSKP